MEHSFYLLGIKKALKARGLNYAFLAEQLKMTESGVKKMLNSKDISLRRVLQICEVMDIVPGQLFTLSEKSAVPTVRFTKAQEEALLKDRQLLQVYWNLSIEKRTPHEIARQMKVTVEEIKKRLQKLVTLDLVTLRQGRYLPKQGGKFRWPSDSLLAKTLNQEWSERVLQKALSDKNKDPQLHRLMALKISENTYQNFLSQMTRLLDDVVMDSQRDELTLPPDQLSNISTLVAVVKTGMFD